MKLITVLLMMAFLAISVLSAATPRLGGPYNGLPFPAEPMEYNVTIDGKFVHGRGTIQQVFAQYAAENPSFTMPSSLSLSSALELEAENDRATSQVDKRGKSNLFCLPDPEVQWLLASIGGTWANINFLKQIQPDLCRFAPKTCRKIACYDSAALWVCNWNDSVLWRACSYLGSYAEDIANQCTEYKRDGYTGGQEDDSDGYSVFVRGEPC